MGILTFHNTPSVLQTPVLKNLIWKTDKAIFMEEHNKQSPHSTPWEVEGEKGESSREITRRTPCNGKQLGQEDPTPCFISQTPAILREATHLNRGT